MNLEVFLYVGLLRFPQQLELSLSLLPEELNSEATKLYASLKDLPKGELRRRWAKLREEEQATMSKTAYERSGIRLESLPPGIRDWCVSRLEDSNE